MNNEVKLYPFGFLFTETATKEVPERYRKKKILDKYYYYYDNSMRKYLLEDNDRFLIIHGEFIHIGIDEMLSGNELLTKLFILYEENCSEFLDTLDFISGRFVIIVGNHEKVEVYPDATNSRSAFFLKNTNTLSSHANLLNDCFNLQESDIQDDFKNILLNTPYEDLGSTIPNYSLTLGTNDFHRFFPRENNKYTHLEEEHKFKLVERFWKEQLNITFEESNNVILSLTGGGDSRTSLALIKEHLDKVKLFTYAATDGMDESNSSTKGLSIDNDIVKQMVKDLKLKHRFFYFDQDDKTLTDDEYNAISKNSIAMHSSFFVAYLRQNYDLKDLIHVRANLLEIGQAYVGRHNHKVDNLDSALQAFNERFSKYINTEEDKRITAEMFYDYVNKTNFDESIYDYTILDLFYWEVFMGRWYPEVLNSHDIVCRTLSPYNHRALIDITLSFPLQKRRERYFQYELIDRNFSVLNFFGLNNVKNLYEQSKEYKNTGTRKYAKKSIFKKFSMVVANQQYYTIETNGNMIFIPKTYLSKGNYSEVYFRFSNKHGIAHLVVNSKFVSKDYKNHICYEVLINDDPLLQEDVSNWSIPNYISIKGVRKDDLIRVRVVVRKEIQNKDYWEDATKIEIKEYREVSSKMTGENGKVNFSSPYTKLLK